MKRISPATVTFGVMAIVLGLVAAYIVRQSLRQTPVVQVAPPAAPAKPDTVPVVFARVNMPKNTRITAADVYVAQVLKDAKAASGTFRGSALAEGRITTQTIRAGQAIRDDYLLAIGEGLPELSERLPPGTRAVTVQIQGADTGGKKLTEGDRIDIALTVEGTHPELGEVLTRTLLRRVLVVDAVAGRPLVRRAARQQEETPPTMVTVAVPPADANKLIVAERTGTLIATLVSLQNPPANAADSSADDAITRRQLLGLKDVPPPKRYTVEKWSGGTVRLIEMSGERIRESRDVSAGRPEETIQAPAPPAALDRRSTALPASIVPSGVTAIPTAAIASASDDGQ